MTLDLAPVTAPPVPPATNRSQSSLQTVVRVCLSSLAAAVGAVFALVFAALLAALALAAGVILSCIGLALRNHMGRRREAGVVLEARKVGHAWIAYSWDKSGR